MNLIKQIRTKRGMKQEDLARELDVGRSTVAKWETGQSNPRFEQIPHITEVLSCTADELLGIAQPEREVS